MSATDAILEELLQATKDMGETMSKIKQLHEKASKGGGGGGGVGGGAGKMADELANDLGKLVDIINPVNVVMGAFKIASNIVAGIFEVMGGILGKVVKGLTDTAANLIEFSKLAAEGKAKLSTLFNAFKDLPFGIGFVASVFSNLTGIIEGNLDNWRKMNDAGVAFGGSLTDMRIAAAKTQLGLDLFVTKTKELSEILATTPGGLMKGVNKFVDVQSKLITPGSKYYDSMVNIGVNAQEAADLLGVYMSSQTSLNKKGLENNDKIAKSVAEFGQELDLYSKVTGQSRKALEDSMKKESNDEVFKSFMTDVGQKASTNINTFLADAQLSTVSGFKEYFKQVVASNGELTVPTTEAMKKLWVMTNGQIEPILKALAKTSLNANATAEDLVKARQAVASGLAQSSAEFRSTFSKSTQAFGMNQQNSYFADQGLIALQNKNLGLTQQQQDKIMANARKEQAEEAARNAEAKRLQDNENRIREYGNNLVNQFYSTIQPLIPLLSGLGMGIMDSLSKLIGSGGFKDTLTVVTDWLIGTFNDLSKATTFSEFMEILKKKAMETYDQLYSFLAPKVEKMWNDIKPVLINKWNELIDFMKLTFDKISTKLFGGKDEPTKGVAGAVEGGALGFAGGSVLGPLIGGGLGMALGGPPGAMLGATIGSAVGPWITGALGAWFGKEHGIPSLGAMSSISGGMDSLKITPSTPKESRASGSLGMTGRLIEDFGAGTDAVLHGNEGIVTEAQMNQILSSAVNAGASNSLKDSIDRLNNLTAQANRLLQDVANHTKQNVSATKALSGNLLA